MAKKKQDAVIENIKENISLENLEDVMSDRYATYAKYVIQDRAIPDVRDGLKPVQRRIVFSMFKSGNLFNRPTKKCAHTVGAVMGTFHPHGDTSIYEALAHMSQDWKVRYPLIDFQGNNGSIDGDSPAAYRYTEARLSELSNELVKDLDKKTVDMQLNFDDTEFEPVVLPSRFPNLLVNGTEGIAVALATEIPPHNLKEVIDAVIYRIGHKNVTIEDLMQFIPGPDFPGGGIIYNSDGLKSIYSTGRGRIEVASKTEITYLKDMTQIVITEIPYKIGKSDLVFEIDKIIHSKTVSGFIEIRDESDWKGIRIVIDCKKEANVELLLNYLMTKTSLVSGYSANMVAIVDGRPKTLNLIDFVDSYIKHQVDVITRRSQFDLQKSQDRLHIVEGLILASININEVVEIIKKSNDKADSKVNLMARYNFSAEQAEAIVTMPLYKLSHTDEKILEDEKNALLAVIEELKGILEDRNKLDRVLIKDLKAISAKYDNGRRTSFADKGEAKPIDTRELIAKEEVMICLTRDGYAKRSTIKSYKSSGDNVIPGVKSGDAIVSMGQALTTDYLYFFTNFGNYSTIPVNKLTENKWKDEGVHLNNFVTLASGEKIIKGICIREFRSDVFIAFLTKNGQIKRTPVNQFEISKRSKPSKCMNLSGSDDEIVSVQILTGNSDLLVLTSNGNASLFNENELSVLGLKAGGVKSINGLNKTSAVSLIAFDEEEKSKVVIFTDKGHERIVDNNRFTRTARLGKLSNTLPCFKQEPHKIVSAVKIYKGVENPAYGLYLSDTSIFEYTLEDTYLTDPSKYAKKNIDIPPKMDVQFVFDLTLEIISKETKSHPITTNDIELDVATETPADAPIEQQNSVENNDEQVQKNPDSVKEEVVVDSKIERKPKEKKDEGFEQMSIFDDLE